MSHGEMPSIIRKLRRAGVRIEGGSDRHWKIYCPAGIVFTSGTPGDVRSIRNFKAQIKRYGLKGVI